MEKAKNFYKKKLRPSKKQLSIRDNMRPLINSAVGDNQKKEHDWCAYKETHKKKEPPLIDHSKVFG